MAFSTVISSVKTTLPTCEPNLMPFHIDYSGPASVSAFMHVEKLKPQEELGTKLKSLGIVHSDTKTHLVEGQTVKEDRMEVDASSTNITRPCDGQDTNVKASGSSTPSAEAHSQATSESTIAVESQTSLSSSTARVSPTPPIIDDADKRFISSFRGRTIHGLTIDLPLGYSGLVLRGEGSNSNRESQENAKNSKAKANNQGHKASTSGKTKTVEAQKPTTKPRGRLTRSAASKPALITIEDEDEKMADAALGASNDNNELTEEQDHVEALNAPPVRNLVPQAQFSSFTLWHADRPVDKGNDEYYRSITEWMALSREVCDSSFKNNLLG